jgi:cobyrinic acid a,c-diamide synthase
MARALLIAGCASGQGKTTFTCALARHLRAQGATVRAFKIGPDFIDPGFLAEATEAPVHNLDLWMVGEAQCAQRLADAALEADWLLIEGAMGLYDGQPNAADLAARFAIPVLGVLDAGAMAETFGAVAMGLEAYGRNRELRWAGVAANQVASPGHARMLRGSLPPGIAWAGHLQRTDRHLPERHLGLVQAHEARADLDQVWQALDAALHLEAATIDSLQPWAPARLQAPAPPGSHLRGRIVAVARDEAFSFCYQANLDTLMSMGAELVFFSPLADQPVPPAAHAVYLPGGYPELHAARLARCTRFFDSLRDAHREDVRIVAECGGMMICARALRDLDGVEHPMAGLLAADAVMGARLAGIGLHRWHTEAGELRGHVFHYGRLEARPALAAAASTEPLRYGTAEAVYRQGSLTASFFHGYFDSNPRAAARLFV